VLTTYRTLLDIMTPSERWRFWTLIGIAFFLSAIEAASVLSILPFLNLISNPELIESNAAIAWLYDYFGFSSRHQFLAASGIALFLITVVGLSVIMVAIWLTTRFALMRAYSISMRLLTRYLHQPYEWYLSQHSADLGNVLISEVDQVVSQSILPAIRVIPEAFTVIILVAALCLLEPTIAISGALLLGLTYGGIYLVVRTHLSRIGRIRLEAFHRRFHALQEAFGGVKELKLLGLEQPYLTRFGRPAYKIARSLTIGQVLSNIPRYALEAVAFGGMILLILSLLASNGDDLAALIPTLGVIAAVGLRLIPALQLVYQRGASLRQSEAALNRIHRDMTELTEEGFKTNRRTSKLPSQALTNRLELRGVRYDYPSSDKPALDGVSLTIDARTTIGIVGGTGAGKTTLVDIILGLIDPTSGSFVVDGVPIDNESRRSWQKSLGYVPQTIFLSDGTVAENIAFGKDVSEIDYEAVERASRIAALHDFVISEMPQGYETPVGERGVRLSGGQRQRVGIARALYHDPATLILDEATSALDTLTERAVMDAVHNIAGKKTIIMIAHRLSTVRECDQIFLLRHGRIADSGRFDELIATDEEVKKMAIGS